MHVCVFPFDTCWLIKSIRLSLFISFSQDWGLTSVTSRMAQALWEHPILLDRTAFDFQHQDASPDASATRAVGYAVCVHLCFAGRTKRRCLFPCYMVARKHGGLLKQTECRCLWCGKKGMWKEQAQADEGMGGITSSLPTRQPWVLLLCWIECNRPKFFSLTTGACELTSSLPWERNCHDKANAFASFFFLLLSLPAPHLCLHLILSSFLSWLCFLSVWLFHSFFLIVYNTWWHYFPSFKMVRKASGWCAVEACCQKLGTFSTFQGNPNWRPALWRYDKKTRNV